MTKVLDDTFLLTEDVTKTMQLVSAPARRSRSTTGATAPAVRKTPSNEEAAGGDGASTPPPVSNPMRRAPVVVSRKPSPSSAVAVAHVSPRVGGHAIHKPQIEIQRLGMDEINRYQEEQRQRRREQEEREREETEEEQEEEDEDEPLAPRNNEGEGEDEEVPDGESPDAQEQPAVEHRTSRSSRYSRYRMSIIGEESEEHTEEEEEEELPPPPPSDRARRRRQRRRRTLINSSFQDLGSPVVLLHDASALLEQYNLSTSRIQGEEDDVEPAEEPADAAETASQTPTRPNRPSKKKVRDGTC